MVPAQRGKPIGEIELIKSVPPFLCALILFTALQGSFSHLHAQSPSGDIVLYTTEAPVRVGAWSQVSDASAAGGSYLLNPNAGAAKVAAPLASPSSYFEITFSAQAGKAYRLWTRSKAQANSPYNDSFFMQFSGSVTSTGSPIFRIGTSDGTSVNLEDWLYLGIQGWGWQDNGWGIGALGPVIFFQNSGVQTLRVQPREDGVGIDQIVLSPLTYLISSPGALKNDNVILPKTSPTPTPTPTPAPTATPTPTPAPSSADIVIWAADVPTTGIRGAWSKQTDSTAAGQVLLRNADTGAPKLLTPYANPTDYFEVTFNAQAGRPYRIWVRGRADNNFWGNDSIYAQFSGSLDNSGAPAYRLGTTSAVDINLEDCSGCGIQGWGWQDNGWGTGILGPTIFFQNNGSQTLRIQRREDGFAIDQIVLSSYGYLYPAPGLLKNDNTILQSTILTANQPPQVSISASPTAGNSPLFVSFSSVASDPDGNIAAYAWDFGNGSTAGTPYASTTYQSPGTYAARLTVYDNAGASASATVQINVSSPPQPSSATLRVLSWNIAFGKGTDNITNWDRTATWITNMNPDVAGLSEMPPDSIGTLVNLVTQKTGRTWYWHFVPKYPNCPEGNLILSKYPLLSTSARYLSYSRSVAQATLSVGGRTINFFATHLDPDSSPARYAQVGELMSWASGFSESRIFVGDFNAGPDTSESVRMTSTYYDTWMRAMSAGTAVAYPDNPIYMHTRTRRGRIDYVWYSIGSGNLFLQGTQIPDTRNLSQTNVVVTIGTLDDRGVRPSDHNPMNASFEIR